MQRSAVELSMLAFLLLASITHAEESTVAIDLRDRAGKPLPAYVGLVPAHSPWRRPIQEELGQSSVEWTVEPGSYRVVAGALGYKTVWGSVFELGTEPRRLPPLILDPLVGLGGTVVDADGNPVRGVRVGLLGQFYEHDFLLSPRAEALLRPNSLVLTDEDGRFVLPVPQDMRVILVFEAAGFAPVVRNNLLVAQTPELSPTVLRRGPTLTVAWKEDARTPLDRLQLRPVNVDLPPEIPPSRAASLWTRPRAGNEQRWTSLFPGEYDVLLRASPLHGSDEPPVQLARLRLDGVEESRLQVQFPTPPAQAAEGRALRLFIRDGKLAEWQQAVVTQWTGETARQLKSRARSVSGGVSIEAAEGCTTGAGIVVTTRESLAATTAVTCDAPVQLRPHATARVRASLAPPTGSTVPATATVRYPACDGGVEHRVPILDGRLDFGAAADCGEAIISTGRFAPVAAAPPQLAPGAIVDLGRIPLAVGGAISIRLLDRDKVPAKGARVFTCRRGEVNRIRGTFGVESLRPIARATADEAGWVRFGGLPDEDLVLAIVRDGERIPWLAGPLRVEARQEQLLEDVILPGTGDLELTVTVDDELASVVRVEGLSLRSTHPLWPPHASVTARHERPSTQLTGLPAGEWSVAPAVSLEGGGSVARRGTNVTVVAGVLNAATIDSGFRAYRGKLTKSGTPLAGHLTFRPSGDTGGTLSSAASGDDGNFIVPLTAPGDYLVRFRDASGRTMELASPARFTSPAVRADVRLGAEKIAGVVLDENRQPVAGANVAAERSRGLDDSTAEAYAKTRDDGSFEIDGLEPGTWTVAAGRADRQSPRHNVTLGPEPATVVLELRDPATVSIVVTAAAGQPVPGATVSVTPVGLPSGVLLHPVVVQTNSSGIAKFRGLERTAARAWNIAVRTREGTVVSALRAPADEIPIALPRSFGTLVLKRGEGDWPRDRYARLIAPDGSSFHPFWAASPDAPGTLVARQLPPGIWRFAETTTPAGAHAIEAGIPGTFEIAGTATVVPGGTAEILIGDRE